MSDTLIEDAILRALPFGPGEARSLGEIYEITNLAPSSVIECLSELQKRYTIIEANGRFSRQYIPELDGENRCSSPIPNTPGGIEHRKVFCLTCHS